MDKMMGVDVGKVRVGVAISDPEGILASPWRTLSRDQESFDDIKTLVNKITQENIGEVYVGLPVTLQGKYRHSAADACAFAQQLANALCRVSRENGYDAQQEELAYAQVLLMDERMTTVMAHRKLYAGGKKTKNHRYVIDQVAAQEILQHAIESKRQQGDIPGIVVRAEI